MEGLINFSEFYGNQLVDGKGKHVGSAVVH